MKILRYGKDDLSEAISRSSIDYRDAISTVTKIMDDVEHRGDEAVLEYTKKLDNVELENIRVSQDRIEEAYESLEDDMRCALKDSHANIASLHATQYQKTVLEWMSEVDEEVSVGERILPLQSVGCYVPGGRASYPSTVLMCVTPAKIAGVQRVVVVTPPKASPEVLAACKIAGADEVYEVGGAQAIAALAYGTQSIKAVHKIVGPGNKYVTAAKMLAYGRVDVDMPAGPSEVLIVADECADPEVVAADILAQAEHDPNAQCVLATDTEKLAKNTAESVKKGAESSPKKDIISASMKNTAFVVTSSLEQALEFANQYAPEHLQITTKDSDSDAKKIRNAGAVFIGAYSPVAAGDYASGANHVLPTGGAAKYSSQLSVRDFLKSMSVQKIGKKGLKRLAKTITTIARAEGLPEHAKSVEKRLK